MSNRSLVCMALIGLLATLCACGGGGKTTAPGDSDTIPMRYAEGIIIEQYDGYKLVTLKNPWKKGLVLHRYLLAPASSGITPTDLQTLAAAHGATLVRTPLQRAAVFTTVHAALIMDFHKENSIAGVADLKYIKIPWIQEQAAKGRIMDCGGGMSPTVEKIIDAQVDAILLSPFENSGYGKLEELDTPIIECAEWMESSPLGRAEWMRFYGMLFGAEAEADALFATVVNTYGQLKQQARTSAIRQTAIIDKQVGSIWYVPGGRSTIGRMLKDAECRYPFADDEHSGSLPLSFETLIERAGDADVWLLRYDSDHPITMSELIGEQHGYAQLRPVSTGEVYACNVRTSLFYEESPFRPDLLLRDFIAILHPDLTVPGAMRYYKKVE